MYVHGLFDTIGSALNKINPFASNTIKYTPINAPLLAVPTAGLKPIIPSMVSSPSFVMPAIGKTTIAPISTKPVTLTAATLSAPLIATTPVATTPAPVYSGQPPATSITQPAPPPLPSKAAGGTSSSIANILGGIGTLFGGIAALKSIDAQGKLLNSQVTAGYAAQAGNPVPGVSIGTPTIGADGKYYVTLPSGQQVATTPTGVPLSNNPVDQFVSAATSSPLPLILLGGGALYFLTRKKKSSKHRTSKRAHA